MSESQLRLTVVEPHPNSLLRSNGDGTFTDVTARAGLLEGFPTQTAAWGDFDNDGWLDLYVVLGGAHPGDVFQNALFLNPGRGNAWITIQLEGVESNRAAIGARIAVTVTSPGGERTYHNVVGTGGSFGASTLQQEIGLGDALAIRSIAVTWPASSRTDVYRDVGLNRWIRIREGHEHPTPVERVRLDLGSGTAMKMSH